MAEFNFSEATAEAVRQLEGTPAPAAEPAAPPVNAAEPVEAQAPQAEAPAPVEAQPVLPSITITHRGKQVTIENPTVDQLRDFVQKGYDYTVKTTELSQKDRQRVTEIETYKSQLEQQIAQQRQALIQFLSDDQQLEAHLAKLRGQRAQQQPQYGQTQELAPDDIPSGQQVLSIAQRIQAQTQQQIAQASQQTKAETQSAVLQAIEQAVLTTQYAQEVESHIGVLKQRFPEVALIEGDDFVPTLKQKMGQFVQQNGVDDVETAKAIMTELVSKKADRLRASFVNREKQAVVAQTRAQQPGIVSPGGTPTTSTASSTTGLKWGDSRITQMAVDALLSGKSL